MTFSNHEIRDTIIYMNREDTIFGDDWPYSKAKSSILRSAASVMLETGPRSATLKNIASKAEVTEPAIFRHFEGVDGVFKALFNVVKLYYAKMAAQFEDDEYKGLDRLKLGTDRMTELMTQNASFAYILARPDPVFRQYEELHAGVAESDAVLKAAVASCVREAKSKGQLNAGVDVDTMIGAFVGIMFQSLFAWVENINGYDLQKEMRKNVQALAAFIRKPGTEVKIIKQKAAPKPAVKETAAPAPKADTKQPKVAKAAKTTAKAAKAPAKAEPKAAVEASPKAPKAAKVAKATKATAGKSTKPAEKATKASPAAAPEAAPATGTKAKAKTPKK